MTDINPEVFKSAETEILLSPEAVANRRFVSLFHSIIDEYAYTDDHNTEGRQVWVAQLPRIDGWKPTKWRDAENLVNRIHVVKMSGYGPSLDYEEVHMGEWDENDVNMYWSKRFIISDDKVGIIISHMNNKLSRIDDLELISRKTMEQAPVELLDLVTDEIETILARSAMTE